MYENPDYISERTSGFIIIDFEETINGIGATIRCDLIYLLLGGWESEGIT
jgi:hypothetical protein